MKKWMVYYINSDGMREGNEYIWARNRKEALEMYRRYFNVNCECRAVPVFERNCVGHG